MDSSETDEALESIDRAFAGVFWGRARSKDGSQEVDGDLGSGGRDFALLGRIDELEWLRREHGGAVQREVRASRR